MLEDPETFKSFNNEWVGISALACCDFKDGDPNNVEILFVGTHRRDGHHFLYEFGEKKMTEIAKLVRQDEARRGKEKAPMYPLRD